MYRHGHITYGFIRFVRPRDMEMEARDRKIQQDHSDRIAAELGYSTVVEFADAFNSLSHSERVRLSALYKELMAACLEPISESELYEKNLQAGQITNLKEDHDSRKWMLVDIWREYQKQNNIDPLTVGLKRKALGLAEYHVAVDIVRKTISAGPDDVQPIDLKRHPAFQSKALLRRTAPCAIHARLAGLEIEEIEKANLNV